MTFFEKLVEEMGVNEAFREACAGCPEHHFPDIPVKDCTEDAFRICGSCWTADMPETSADA